jgi:hypothetical protein
MSLPGGVGVGEEVDVGEDIEVGGRGRYDCVCVWMIRTGTRGRFW